MARRERLTSQVRVRACGEDFAFASIVCEGWSVFGIRVQDQRITWPRSGGVDDDTYPVVTPPPEIRDQIEAEILLVYRRAAADRKKPTPKPKVKPMIRPERTKPWRRRHLRRPDPDPEADDADQLPPEDPNPPTCRHCLQPIRYGGLVVVSSATLHAPCERGWRARKLPPLI